MIPQDWIIFIFYNFSYVCNMAQFLKSWSFFFLNSCLTLNPCKGLTMNKALWIFAKRTMPSKFGTLFLFAIIPDCHFMNWTIMLWECNTKERRSKVFFPFFQVFFLQQHPIDLNNRLASPGWQNWTFLRLNCQNLTT